MSCNRIQIDGMVSAAETVNNIIHLPVPDPAPRLKLVLLPPKAPKEITEEDVNIFYMVLTDILINED